MNLDENSRVDGFFEGNSVRLISSSILPNVSLLLCEFNMVAGTMQIERKIEIPHLITFYAFHIFEKTIFISGVNSNNVNCIVGISPTNEMENYCKEVNKLYKALGFSSRNRSIDKPVHQHDTPVDEAFELINSCSRWFNT